VTDQLGASPKSGGHHRHGHDEDLGPQPTVCALRVDLAACSRDSGQEHATRSLAAFVEDLVAGLRVAGCRLIGHIKGTLDAGERGSLFFSVTSFDTPAVFHGELSEPVGACSLTLNAIVFDIDETVVETAVLAGVMRHLGPAT
jgi:hypothetical protein